MLSQLKKLNGSLSEDQRKDLRRVLGDDLYELFANAAESITEDEASQRVEKFAEAAGKSPLKVFKARKILTRSQKDIVLNFIKD